MENIKDRKGNIKENVIEDTKEKITVVGEGLTLFERLLSVAKNYSMWEIFKTLFVALLVIYVGFTMLNPTYLLDKYDEMKKKEHAQDLNTRFTQTRIVSSELSVIMNKLHADRAFFIEYHNSVKSLQGAPFAFGSMDFEEVNEGVMYMGDEYTNFSLTKYKFVNYLSDKLIFIGTIEELEVIDKRLYLKLLSNEVKQVALIEVEGTENPLGILGITWSKHDVISGYYDKIKREIRAEAVKLAIILDTKKGKKDE